MTDPLGDCVARFGAAPRSFSFWDRLSYLRLSKPSWLRERPTDKLHLLFSNAPMLFANGVVVWGQVIQANRLLFEDGDADCPGELVYSLADRRRVDPQDHADVADELFSLKGAAPTDAALAEIADYLTDECIRVFGLAVPPAVSPRLRCRISTTFFVRKHLPNRRLCMTLLPIVVSPAAPHVAMPLPHKYWPPDLIAWWSG